MAPKPIQVYLEAAPKRSFAVAHDWPGWARSGKTEADALAALADYAPRYAKVVGRHAGFEAPAELGALKVTERLEGSATTEFGAPGAIPAADERPLDEAELERQIHLLERAWWKLDAATDAAQGAKLRLGPRGGGRQLPKILEHVVEAEASYLHKLGAKHRGPLHHGAMRASVVDALNAIGRGQEAANPSGVRTRWPVRYFVRRAAWHVLDHAWEIEDRSGDR